MGKVVLDITMSLDGFVAATNVDIIRPMGDDGMCLHNWLFGDGTVSASKIDREIANEVFTSAGAVVIGRRMFDVGEPQWGDDGAFGMPCFVLTHRDKDMLVRGATMFTFVTDGIHSALE